MNLIKNLKKPKYVRMIILIIVWALSYYFMNVSANIASFNSVSNLTNKILPDIGFKYIPKIDLLWLTDFFDLLTILPTFILILTLSNNKLKKVTNRALLTSTICNFIRISTLTVTSCIDPRTNCIKVKEDLFTKFELHRCGDCMYSGHTLVLVLCALIFSTYNKNYKLLNFIIWFFTILGSLIIISNRAHYTSDVLIAYYIVLGVWFTLPQFIDFYNLTFINKNNIKEKRYLPLNINEVLNEYKF